MSSFNPKCFDAMLLAVNRASSNYLRENAEELDKPEFQEYFKALVTECVKTSFKQFSINHNYEKLKEQSLEHSDEEKTTEKLITKVCVGELPSPIKTYNRKRERNSSHDENDIRSKRQKISISDSDQNSTESQASSEKLKCNYCTKMLKNKLTLEQHNKHKHADKYPYPCPKCYTGFLNEEQQKRHSSDCKKRIFVCYLCNIRRTEHLEILQKHMTSKHTNKKFLCTFTGCDSAFKTEATLRRHINNSHGKSS